MDLCFPGSWFTRVAVVKRLPVWAQNRHIEDEAHARSQWRSWYPSYSVLAPYVVGPL